MFKTKKSDIQNVYRFCGTRGTRTPNLLLRRQLLYPAELQAHITQDRLIIKTGAGDGNRTHVFSLEG